MLGLGLVLVPAPRLGQAQVLGQALGLVLGRATVV